MAKAVSDDGLTIVGKGVNPDGKEEAWLVRLDEGITLDEQEKWFNEDDSFSPDQISEGELKFLPEPPENLFFILLMS